MITPDIFAIVMFISTLLLMLFGFPVAFTLAGSALIFAFIGELLDIFNFRMLFFFPQRIYGVMINEALVAVPLFIFMGVMLEKSGVAVALLENMSKIWGEIRGGLVYSVLIVGVLMAASTGIVGATVVTMGILSLPLMLKWNYNKKMSAGIICASGTLGQIIPPSIVLVLLADIFQGANEQASQISGNLAPTPVSSVDLFAGAIIPGMLLVILYGIWILINSILKPGNFPVQKENKDKVILRDLLGTIFPPIALIMLVLGSILFGIATPTESASLGALGSIIIAMKNKLKMEIFKSACIETLKINSMVFFILIGASLFSLVFRGFGGDLLVESFLIDIPGAKINSLIIVMITIFILGFFLDFFQIVFVIVPIVGPSLISMGYDPIWLAIMFAINLQTSFLTPPFGFALFYLRGVAPKEIKTSDIYSGVIPYILIQLSVLFILFKFPYLVTWLPSKL